MPEWKSKVERPTPDHFISWEIYSHTESDLKESETIEALNGFVDCGFLSIESRGPVWYVLKDRAKAELELERLKEVERSERTP